MRAETTEQKYDRLRMQIQEWVLNGYPNPGREGCPGAAAIAEYARRAADFEDGLEREANYEHITHCSPCYREFLDAREELRRLQPREPAGRMPWLVKWRMRRTLGRLEKVMESVVAEVRGRRRAERG